MRKGFLFVIGLFFIPAFVFAGNLFINDNNTGNVGIGTDSVGFARFNVNITQSEMEGVYITRDSGITTPYSYFNVENESGSTVFKINESGNVGIGTGNPGSNFHLVGSANSDILSISDDTIRWRFGIDSSHNLYLDAVSSSNRPFTIKNSGSGSAGLIVDSGNVGIGTTTPSYKLDVNGDINISDTNAYKYAGYDVLKFPTKGYTAVNNTSTIIGRDAGDFFTNNLTPQQTAVGYQAGNLNTGAFQTVFGPEAGKSNSGFTQLAVGYKAGKSNLNAYQIAFGYEAGISNAADYQTTMGFQSGKSNTGTFQISIGRNSGESNTAVYQIAIGDGAGKLNEGIFQTSIGYKAGESNEGTYQVAVGYETGKSNTGIFQTAVGYKSGYSNSGDFQIATGYEAGYSNEGDRTIGIGYSALEDNTASDVVAIGHQAGYENTVANQFIVQQRNINATPLIQGNFLTGNLGLGVTDPQAKLTIPKNEWISSSNVDGTSNVNMFRVNSNGEIQVGAPLIAGTLTASGIYCNRLYSNS